MGLILLIVVIGALYYFSKKSNENNIADNSANWSPDAQLRQRNHEWAAFIAGYLPLAKTKAEKELVAKMLSDIKAQGLVGYDYVQPHSTTSPEHAYNKTSPEHGTAVAAATPAYPTAQVGVEIPDRLIEKQKDALAIKLDNISLLLYFGAFLFVASVGLFVGFAKASGELRTLAVLLVAAILYGTGVWIYANKTALKPAGLTFAGIGIAVTPLVGVAAYNYVFKDSAALVWLATSLLCLLMYTHALVTLRQPLINYIFMFTLLSLFESGVAVVEAPIYYYGWAMAAVSIGLQAISLWKNLWPDFRESSRVSSQFFLPIAVFVSLSLASKEGVGQLGVSLLLAALYYGLEALQVKDAERENNAVVAHISGLAGITCLTYSVSNDTVATGSVLMGLTLLQLAAVVAFKKVTSIVQNFGTVLLASSVVSLVFLVENAVALTLGICSLVIVSLVIWLKQQRVDGYVLAGLGWIALPVVFGQLVIEPKLPASSQAWLSILALVVHLGVFVGFILKKKNELLTSSARTVLLLQIVAALTAALFASPGVSLLLICVIGLLMLPLSVFDENEVWETFSGAIVALSVVRCWNDTLLSVALFISLAYSILLALRFRSESNRWLSTVLWMLIPIGLGGLTTTNAWSPVQYAWSYVMVMLGLIVSRAIARGVVFASSKIPLGSYVKTASLSYVFGYVLAGSLAVSISLGTDASQQHTTLILGVMSILGFLLAWVVEKRSDLIALQPVLWQAILLSALRPEASSRDLEIYLLLSTSLATFCYAMSRLLVGEKAYAKYISGETMQVALLTTFIAPSVILFVPKTVWSMPLGLFVAGIILYDYWRFRKQSNHEIATGVVVASVMWFMYYFGVREFQAYTHVLALTLGCFAYWRHLRNEKAQSDTYLYWMLATATIPLALQALSGEAGGLYGWWLLLEQIVFMLLGMSIRRHFVTMWGLYVAVASVLYQLRNLGWAALTFLALFVIGVAVFQLQKYNKPDQ